eukprot:TRINITY_DN5524_c0_g1_i1.p1 TRINITY_DN5524_c0_g1~~TRINITY_DN5524_c0_g1_i1.p1  ORF type:complete len:187 (+),score=74.47 TRINITY_DN5524_c0_g1_i1:96-656(+)
MMRRPPRSPLSSSSAASDVYKRQAHCSTLRYTEDELKARDPNFVTAAERQKENQRQKVKRVRGQVMAMLKTIPSDTASLYSHRLDWGVVDQAGIIQERMLPWVTKKIADYLGEEEQSMIQFVLTMLTEHTPPKICVDKLEMILEEDAPAFVLKMWRMLVFEFLRWEIENGPEEEEQEFSLLGALGS